MNQTHFTGRLTSEPELKHTQSGTPVCSFTLAVKRPKVKDTTDFINCVAWRQAAEFLCRYFRKGSSVCITGSIQTRSWTDQHNFKRFATEVVADKIMFVDNKGEGTSAGAENTEKGSSVPPAIDAVTAPNFEALNNDEDLPF